MGNEDFIIKSKKQSIEVSDIKGGLNFAEIANDPKLIDIFKKCDKNGNNILDSTEISVFLNQVKESAGEDGELSEKELKKFLKQSDMKQADVDREGFLGFMKKLIDYSAKTDIVSSTNENGIEKQILKDGTQKAINPDGKYSLTYINSDKKEITDYFDKNGHKYKSSQIDDNGSLIESSFFPDGSISSKTITYKNNSKDEFLYMSDNTLIHNFYTGNGKLLERIVEEKDTHEAISRTSFNNDGEVIYFDNSSYPINGLQKQISLKYIKCCDSENILTVMKCIGEYENPGTPEEKYISLSDKVLASNMSESEKREALKYLGQKLAEHTADNNLYSSGLSRKLENLIADENFDLQKASDAIDNLLLELNKENKKPNGDIDADFRQGQTGDCWFLSTIQALRNSPQGQALLDDSVNIDPETENIIVNLKGVNKTYTITPQELEDSDKLSFGDLDVRAMEIAVQRYFKENPIMGKTTIDGNNPAIAFKLLTGFDVIQISNYIQNPYFLHQLDKKNNNSDSNIFAASQQSIATGAPIFMKNKHFYDGMLDMMQKRGTQWVFVASTKEELDKKYTADVSFKDILSGNGFSLVNNHAYAIKKVDKDYVYLINPHDTSLVVKIPRADFLECFEQVTIFAQ